MCYVLTAQDELEQQGETGEPMKGQDVDDRHGEGSSSYNQMEMGDIDPQPDYNNSLAPVQNVCTSLMFIFDFISLINLIKYLKNRKFS